MDKMKAFLCENMPHGFKVRFTVKRAEGKAAIAGEIVMCDPVGQAEEKSSLLFLSPEQLHDAAYSLSILQPDKNEFFSALDMVLEQVCNY